MVVVSPLQCGLQSVLVTGIADANVAVEAISLRFQRMQMSRRHKKRASPALLLGMWLSHLLFLANENPYVMRVTSVRFVTALLFL